MLCYFTVDDMTGGERYMILLCKRYIISKYCHLDKSGASHFYITTKESKIDTFSFPMHSISFFDFSFHSKKKKSNKKLNTEAGTLRVNHVSYDTDTDLITK